MSSRNWILGGLLLLLALVPPAASFFDAPFYLDLLRRVMIFGIAAISLNLILGYGGMVSFGHAAYLGIGAYAVGVLAHYGIHNGWLQWGLAIGASALVALAIGAISVRTSGIYFIMITLAFTQMLYYLGISIEEYGGDDGMRLKVRSQFSGLVDLNDAVSFYYVVLALLVLSLVLVQRLVNSRFGMVIQAARSNEARTRAIGFSPYRLFALPLPPRRLRHLRRAVRPRGRTAGQSYRLPDAGIHELDALGRTDVHGDPGRHRHQRRPAARRGGAIAAGGRAAGLERAAEMGARALAALSGNHSCAGGAVRQARPCRFFTWKK